jgi:hypothetical protein
MEKEKKTKTVKIDVGVRNEVRLISAIVRARGSGTFMEDLFKALVLAGKKGMKLPEIKNHEYVKGIDYVMCNDRIETELLADLRILAAENGMSVKAYMEGVYNWLAEEHKAKGRVWFDDTSIELLPIRRR